MNIEMIAYWSDWDQGTQGMLVGASEMGLQCPSWECTGSMSGVSPYHQMGSTKKKHQDSAFFDFTSPLATDSSFHIVHSVTDHLKTSWSFLVHRSCTGLGNCGCGLAVKVAVTGNYFSIFTATENVGQRAHS